MYWVLFLSIEEFSNPLMFTESTPASHIEDIFRESFDVKQENLSKNACRH